MSHDQSCLYVFTLETTTECVHALSDKIKQRLKSAAEVKLCENCDLDNIQTECHICKLTFWLTNSSGFQKLVTIT